MYQTVKGPIMISKQYEIANTSLNTMSSSIVYKSSSNYVLDYVITCS